MVRTVKDHDSRRNEILDTAQQLFYQKGYEETSIQDLLNAVGIAKGTFYHYFDSKQALLEELVTRMVAQTIALVEPIVADPQRSALEKFEQFFNQVGQWKAERRGLLLQVLRAYYRDENILLRHKMVISSFAQVAPMLAAIIEQGIAEGVFATKYVAETAQIVLKTTQNLSETIAMLILEPPPDALAILERQISAHHKAIERILEAPSGSLQLFALAQVRQWLE